MSIEDRPENEAPDLADGEPEAEYVDPRLDEAPAADVPQDHRDPRDDAVPE